MNMKNIVLMGILYSGTSNIFGQIIQIITKLVLARLLLPQDFGLMAALLSTTNIINIFFNLGWGDELIQRKQDLEKALGTITTVFLISSILLTLISFFFANNISLLLNQSQLSLLLKMYSISFIIYSITIIYLIYAQKNLLFKERAFCEILSNCIFAILAIALAKLNFGVWSLLLAQLIHSLTLLASLMISIKWLPTLIFDWETFKSIFKFVKETAASYIFSIGILYTDNLFIAKFLGAEQLGFYAMAFSLASIPVISITHSISATMFPIFSKAKDDFELKNIFLKTLHLNFLILLPIIGLGIILADNLINIFLSQKWIPIILLLQVLLIYSLLRSFCAISSFLILSKSKPKVLKKVYLLEFLLLIGIIIPGLKFFGIYGALFAVLFARLSSSTLLFLYTKKSLSINAAEYIDTFFLTFKITLTSMLLLILLKKFIFFRINIFNSFLLLLVAMMLLGTFTFLFDKKSFLEFSSAAKILKNKIVDKYNNLRFMN